MNKLNHKALPKEDIEGMQKYLVQIYGEGIKEEISLSEDQALTTLSYYRFQMVKEVKEKHPWIDENTALLVFGVMDETPFERLANRVRSNSGDIWKKLEGN